MRGRVARRVVIERYGLAGEDLERLQADTTAQIRAFSTHAIYTAPEEMIGGERASHVLFLFFLCIY